VEGRATVVNLVNHTYFNLSGLAVPVYSTELSVEADAVLATDSDSVPTGTLLPVHGTRFDFAKPRPLGLAAATYANRYAHTEA
jgi:aldose 1-epimerase